MFNENKPTENLSTNVKLIQPAIKQPAFNGGIGLATWDTKTAYKDIEVIQNNKTVFKSDFINDLNNWLLLRGEWKLQDSSLAETAYGAQTFAMLKNKNFDNYTLKLKAKKLEGYNAFIIPFAVKDSNTFYRAHIGAWVNKIGVFEKVINGYDVSNISAAVDLPDTIQPNKWYDITLDVGVDTVKCYLDGKLLMTYTEPDKLFAISGKDENNGDIIVKIVNGYGSEIPVDIDFKNGDFKSSNILLITLSSPSLTDENSFDEPEKYIPVTKQLPGGANKISLQLKPYSINILRIKPVQ